MVTIRKRDGSVLVERAEPNLKAVVAALVSEKESLGRADLGGADLRGADLRWADLRGADLRWADLRGADLRGADLGRAKLRGTKLNWQSHDLVAEVVRHEAGKDVEKRKAAGLFLVSRDWCWGQFLALESDPLYGWVLDTLAARVVEGDDAPDVLRLRAAAPAA